MNTTTAGGWFGRKNKVLDQSVEDGGNKKTKKANPYLDARREWNAQFGRQVAERNSWRMVALFALLLALLSLGGLLTLGASTKVVPYVAVIDDLGNPIAQGSATSTGVADPRVIRAVIGDFFNNFRSVTTRWLRTEREDTARLCVAEYCRPVLSRDE